MPLLCRYKNASKEFHALCMVNAERLFFQRRLVDLVSLLRLRSAFAPLSFRLRTAFAPLLLRLRFAFAPSSLRLRSVFASPSLRWCRLFFYALIILVFRGVLRGENFDPLCYQTICFPWSNITFFYVGNLILRDFFAEANLFCWLVLCYAAV